MSGDDVSDTILSQKVYGELVVTYMSLVRNVSVNNIAFFADRPRYAMLFRKHVSRTAPDNWRAVLEGVGLDRATIQACQENYPRNVEEAVQAGLSKWSEGDGVQPPTWGILVEAMEYANIAPQHIQRLKNELGLTTEGMYYTIGASLLYVIGIVTVRHILYVG